ncbi:hypothetical protein OPV22_005562 [Ensete ventricosum]|uniref:ABC transmembrane type-1 domain-containing protein n=1 Tax=Ensete ventricosum TaxID=4639 RepID=A0AAV8RPT3_ENSVE|nr:hypothetical protein OPV22_005562 [Ensete ventricosum]
MLMGIHTTGAGEVLTALATFSSLQDPIILALLATISVLIQSKKLPRRSSEVAIKVSNGNFSWDASSGIPTVKGLNFQVLQEMKVAVCGAVGFAYVSESPWIQSGSIQDNIILGKEMDEEKYDRVLEACSSKNNLEECLLGFLASKTVVNIADQVVFVPSADFILSLDRISIFLEFMKEGRIAEAGKYSEILNSEAKFMELVGAHIDDLVAHNMVERSCGTSSNSIRVDSSESKNLVHRLLTLKEGLDRGEYEKSDEIKQKGEIVQEEEREKGKVGFWVYWRYITMTHKGSLVPLKLMSQILFQILQVCSNYWITLKTPTSDDLEPHVSGSLLINVYVALAVGSFA